jgi:peptidoglycan glycosyltransferase
MNKVKRRTLIILVFVAAIVLGSFSFLLKLESNGPAWAAFASNDHTHSRGIFSSGQVLDRDGLLLLSTVDGYRVYHENRSLRLSTLHAVGDAEGNIGGSATSSFQKQLMGYNMVNGVYSLSGKGRNLYLTIDAELNQAAWEALNGRSGCVAIANYRSGEIICMVSSPGFDPGSPPENPSYINRFLSGVFAPGSIFKLVTAQAALENLDTAAYHYSCSGSAEYDGRKIICQERHGELDFAGSLAVSCNCSFAEMAQSMGTEVLAQYVSEAGLTDALEINGFTTVSGSFDLPENNHDLGWAAVGQHLDMLNPAAMLRYVCSIANEGKARNLQLIKRVTTSNGIIPVWINTEGGSSRIMSEASAASLSELMKNNVESNYRRSINLPPDTAAKSGTAEVGSGSPHSWFTGFVEDEAHPYAFIVLVENGGSGTAVAGSIAGQVLQKAGE